MKKIILGAALVSSSAFAAPHAAKMDPEVAMARSTTLSTRAHELMSTAEEANPGNRIDYRLKDGAGANTRWIGNSKVGVKVVVTDSLGKNHFGEVVARTFIPKSKYHDLVSSFDFVNGASAELKLGR